MSFTSANTINLRTLAFVAILGACLLRPEAVQGGIIVNIDATQSGLTPGTSPTFAGDSFGLVGVLNQLTLAAGTYTITNATGLPGANPNFTAWRFNGNDNWVWNYVIGDDATKKVVLFGWAGGELPSAIGTSQGEVAALLSVQNYSQILTLAAPTTLDFMVRDYYLPDNAGGIALNVQSTEVAAVPEPSSLSLLGLGLVLFGWRRWLGKSQIANRKMQNPK